MRMRTSSILASTYAAHSPCLMILSSRDLPSCIWIGRRSYIAIDLHSDAVRNFLADIRWSGISAWPRLKHLPSPCGG
jgi:hypothetical protein